MQINSQFMNTYVDVVADNISIFPYVVAPHEQSDLAASWASRFVEMITHERKNDQSLDSYLERLEKGEKLTPEISYGILCPLFSADDEFELSDLVYELFEDADDYAFTISSIGIPVLSGLALLYVKAWGVVNDPPRPVEERVIDWINANWVNLPILNEYQERSLIKPVVYSIFKNARERAGTVTVNSDGTATAAVEPGEWFFNSERFGQGVSQAVGTFLINGLL